MSDWRREMDEPLHGLFSALERRPNPKQTLTSSGQLNKWVTAARRARCRRFTLVVVWRRHSGWRLCQGW